MDFDEMEYLERVNMLGLTFDPLTVGKVPEPHQVYASFKYGKERAGELRTQMETFNKNWNLTFYEGVVAKRTDSRYFYGTSSTNWRKFRFTYD